MNKAKSFSVLSLLSLVLSVSGASGQVEHERPYPEVGKHIPDYTFSDVDYFSKHKVSISDFHGKWLLLDFWERFCASCIAGMPELSQLQTQMGDKLQILLVGLNFTKVWGADRKSHPCWTGDDFSRALYQQIRERDGVALPVAWDTALFKKFAGGGVPLTIVVDPAGVVRAITSGINRRQLESLMADGHPPLSPYELDNGGTIKRAYDYELPLLTTGRMANGGTDSSFLFRDILATVSPEISYSRVMLFRAGTFTILNEPLAVLYRIAYTGKDIWDNYDTTRYGHVLERVILRSRDSFALRLGQRYCYSLTLYKDTGGNYKEASTHDQQIMQQILQRDLALNFRYKASLEDTMADIFELIVLDSAKARELTSKKGGPREMRVYASQIEVRNTPMNEFAILVLQRTLQHWAYVVNKTGIEGNIDLEANDCLMGTLNDVNETLRKFGLHLQRSRKLMKAVVVSD